MIQLSSERIVMMVPESSRNSSTGRWVIFIVLAILAILVTYGTLLYSTSDSGLLSTFLIVPMVLLMLFAAFRWAQGRPIASVDESSDRRIFDSMTRHALPAEHVAGLDMLRCPQCGFSFEITNATPVEDEVVLCPSCRTRLFVG
jgi:DNA-directed RNA polymerase subunit RPC12/RpoP